jgi:hypothetical protein
VPQRGQCQREELSERALFERNWGPSSSKWRFLCSGASAKRLLAKGDSGRLRSAEPWDKLIPHLEQTIGENAYRHFADVIGWIFEINAHDNHPRAFRSAERTHTIKNLRDHLLKEKRHLEAAYINFLHRLGWLQDGNRGSVTYAPQTPRTVPTVLNLQVVKLKAPSEFIEIARSQLGQVTAKAPVSNKWNGKGWR